MSAKHALLGLLIDKPSYPYELANRLQARLGPTWEINQGQVYATVQGLERDGLIERVEGSVETRRGRNVYAITDRGVAEFERWFGDTSAENVGARLSRRPLLLKITLAGPERLGDALEQIGDYERDCLARLGELARMHDTMPNEGPRLRADNVLLRLNLSAAMAELEGELRWAGHAREMVSWLITHDAIWPSGARRGGTEAEQTRNDVRAELFGRMAAKTSGPSERLHDGA